MKKLLLLLSILLLSGGVHAQIYTNDDGGGMAGPPPPQSSRYRLRHNYPTYPMPQDSGSNSPDTVEVGRPYYYPYYYGGYPTYPNPGVQSDGNSVYVPGM